MNKNRVIFNAVVIIAIIALCAGFAVSCSSFEREDIVGSPLPIETEATESRYEGKTLVGLEQAGEAMYEDDFVHVSDRVILTYSAYYTINDTTFSQEDTLFYVSIVLRPDRSADGTFEYEGRTLREWYDDPSQKAYEEEYSAWYENDFPDFAREMIAHEEAGDPEAINWEKTDPWEYFDEIWREKHTQEEIDTYDYVSEKSIEARKAYEKWFYTHKEERAALDAELYARENERLQSLGYDVELTDTAIRGFLTKDQIVDFAVSEENEFMEYNIALNPLDKTN